MFNRKHVIASLAVSVLVIIACLVCSTSALTLDAEEMQCVSASLASCSCAEFNTEDSAKCPALAGYRRVRSPGDSKHATAHTFRRSFAIHLLDYRYDIRTVQELLAHKAVTYAHVPIRVAMACVALLMVSTAAFDRGLIRVRTKPLDKSSKFVYLLGRQR